MALDKASSDFVARRAGTAQALLIVLCGTMPVLAILSLVPVLPQLLAHFGNEPNHQLLVPMILTLPSVMTVLLSSGAGWLADRWGRRRLLVVSLAAFTVLGTLPYALESLYAVLATRLIVGVAEAGILTATNTLMGDYFEGTERETWLGRQVMLGPFIGSIYVVSGGALGSLSLHAPFLMYLIGAPLLVAVLALMWEPQRPASASAHEAAELFHWGGALGMVAVTITVGIFFFVQLVQHGRIFSDLGATSAGQIGLLVTAAGLGNVVGGFIYGRIAGWPLSRLLALQLLLFAVGFVGLTFAPNLAVGFAFDFVAMVGGGLVLPTLMSWVLRKFPVEHRGRGVGTWAAAFSLAQFISPAMTALAGLATSGFLQTIGVMGVLAALLAAFAWRAGSLLDRL